MTCSICLEALRDPVITPCGHVFCSQCLTAATERSEDPANAPCPSCRTNFSLMVPNKMFIPKKYWPFIDSNVRRVYFDGENGLSQERIEQLEGRVNYLEKQKELLMDRCEAHMHTANAHAEKEKEARLQCERLRRELQTANHAVRKLVESEVQRSIKSDRTREFVQSTIDDASQRNGSEDLLPRLTRDPLPGFLVDLDLLPTIPKRLGDAYPTSRPSIPLPKRRRVSRPA